MGLGSKELPSNLEQDVCGLNGRRSAQSVARKGSVLCMLCMGESSSRCSACGWQVTGNMQDKGVRAVGHAGG